MSFGSWWCVGSSCCWLRLLWVGGWIVLCCCWFVSWLMWFGLRWCVFVVG